MAKHDQDKLVRLDLNNPVFQENLLTLQKPDRHAALDSLNKIRQMSWNQFYRDSGLKWEKIISVNPPAGVDAIYSFRITQSRRATAYRDGDFIRLLTIAPDHDNTYGKKWFALDTGFPIALKKLIDLMPNPALLAEIMLHFFGKPAGLIGINTDLAILKSVKIS